MFNEKLVVEEKEEDDDDIKSVVVAAKLVETVVKEEAESSPFKKVPVFKKKIKKIIYNTKSEPEAETTTESGRFPGAYIYFNTVTRVSGLSRSTVANVKPLHSNLFRK